LAPSVNYDGSLSDGRTAARLKVTVRLAEAGLAIDGGERGLIWAFEDLRLADEQRRGQPVRLLNVAQADARLTIEDNAILRPLYAMAPHLRDPGVMGRRPGLRLVQWAAGIAALVVILFYGLPWAAEPVAALMPLEWEEAMGERVMREFSQGDKACDGADGRRALDRLTGQLTAVADTPYTFRVTVVDTKDVNAFAGPGGYIVIFRGLITAAETPDEVAGVLAHEMGHVIERHATEGIVRAAGLGLIVQILIGDPSGLVGLGAAAGEFLITLAYSREAEAEADAVAVEILAAADIDAGGLVRFLERMARREGDAEGGLVSFLSTHPQSAERAEAVRNTGTRGDQGMSDRDWAALRAICA
jgi:Zn-dependent protease with chaperone function